MIKMRYLLILGFLAILLVSLVVYQQREPALVIQDTSNYYLSLS